MTNSKPAYVGINDLVKRQTEDSRFSHYVGTWDELAALANKYLSDPNRVKAGYRCGVCEVSVPPEGFFSAVVRLQEGDRLIGSFEARKDGEYPRKTVGVVGGKKLPAKKVSLILYHWDVLEEGGERSTECNWEVVSINASATEDTEPINVGALMANHFGASGGTKTNMTDSEFVEALRKSWEYWKDKAMIAQNEKPQTLPTKPGWHWCRCKETSSQWSMVLIVEESGKLFFEDLNGDIGREELPPKESSPFEFVGPLTRPPI